MPPYRENSSPAHVDDDVSGVVNVTRFDLRLGMLEKSHAEYKNLAVGARELLITVCGTDGRNGKLSMLFTGQGEQGRRIGALEAAVAAQATEIKLLGSALRDARKEIAENKASAAANRVTIQGVLLRVVAISAALAAAGIGVSKIL